MALLYVDEIKASLRGQIRRIDVRTLQPLQIVITDQWVVRRKRLYRVERRRVLRDDRRAVAEASGVRELKADEQIAVVPEAASVGRPSD